MSSEQETVSGEQERKPVRWHPRFVFCLLLAAAISYAAFAPVQLPEGGIAVEIAPGTRSQAIAEALKKKGVIRSKWLFVFYTALVRAADRLRPGVYTFEGRMGIPAVARTLTRGGFDTNEVAITIPEGWDLRDVGAYLAHESLFTAEAFWRVTGLPAAEQNDASL